MTIAVSIRAWGIGSTMLVISASRIGAWLPILLPSRMKSSTTLALSRFKPNIFLMILRMPTIAENPERKSRAMRMRSMIMAASHHGDAHHRYARSHFQADDDIQQDDEVCREGGDRLDGVSEETTLKKNSADRGEDENQK